MKDYRKVHCKKQFRGLVDIRDHIVKRAISESENITVTCDHFPGERVFTPEMLKNPVKISRPFKANYGEIKEYHLYSYSWD